MKPYPFSLDRLPPQTTKRSRWARFVDRHLPRIVIYLLVAHPAGSRAVALRSGDGPERVCRRPLEAFRKRYGDRSASAQR